MTAHGSRGMFGVRGSGDTSGYGRLQPPVESVDTAVRPYGSYFDALVDRLAAVLAPVTRPCRSRTPSSVR